MRVFVRVRPPREKGDEPTLRLPSSSAPDEPAAKRLWLSGERASGEGTLQFEYDGIFPDSTSQTDAYEAIGRPLVDAALAGHAACLMCYGQTGTGKTYTFGGGECLRAASKKKKKHASARSSKAAGVAADPAGAHGVVGRALRQVVEWATPRGAMVCIAYVQVYMELLQDLIRPESILALREHPELGVYVDGAHWLDATDAESACASVAKADASRATCFTTINEDSSRSHAALLISIRDPSEPAAASDPASLPWAGARGKLYLVDLAGSERTKRSGTSGHNFEEACSINQSLTSLGRCVSLLAAGRGKKAPFRESKLTRLLSPCLGAATTSLVCCVSPDYADRHETLNTLEFGANAMRVTLKPLSLANVDYKALCIELQATPGTYINPTPQS